MKVKEFEDILNQLTAHDLDELRSSLYHEFDSSPIWDTGGTKSQNIRHFTWWVKGNRAKIGAVLKLVSDKLKEKAAYPVRGPVPNTKYVSEDELKVLPSYPYIAQALDYGEKSSFTSDGYLSVNAIYNMAGWANWKLSSLSPQDRELAQAIDNLPLVELMRLNKGRRMDQPALFPAGMLK